MLKPSRRKNSVTESFQKISYWLENDFDCIDVNISHLVRQLLRFSWWWSYVILFSIVMMMKLHHSIRIFMMINLHNSIRICHDDELNSLDSQTLLGILYHGSYRRRPQKWWNYGLFSIGKAKWMENTETPMWWWSINDDGINYRTREH